MNTIEIQVWMKRKGHTQAEIAKELRISPTLVSYTITGRAKNRRVLRWLVDHGCPDKYLDFPKRKAA